MINRNLINGAAALGACFVGASAAMAQLPKATTTLQMNPTILDFKGSRTSGTMYMPDGVQLSAKKPAFVTKEPKYVGTPMYGTFTLGTGPKSLHALVLDTPATGDAKIYFDLKGDGDLTSTNGAWPEKSVNDGLTQYEGTFVFRASYGTKTKETSSDSYGLNFYYGAGRSSIFYYRAAALTGKVKLGDNYYSVKVIENNNSGVFNESFEKNGKPTKPVWLVLDGNMLDIRGTFPLDGVNYLATLSPDGTKFTMEATYKAITPPSRSASPKQEELLSVGTMAPDFEVPAYKGGTVRLSNLRGKVVVLDFWATWCGPCKASLPHVEKVHQQVKDKGVYVLALNVFDDKPAYTQWVPANKQYTFNFAFDPAGRGDASIAKSQYLVRGIPTTYVIAPDGKIAATIVGFDGLNDHRLEEALAALKVDIKVPEGAKKAIPMIGLGGASK